MHVLIYAVNIDIGSVCKIKLKELFECNMACLCVIKVWTNENLCSLLTSGKTDYSYFLVPMKRWQNMSVCVRLTCRSICTI